MELQTFEQLITKALLTIPKRIRDRMDNVVFVVEDVPRRPSHGEKEIAHGHTLLGLYQGVPLARRGTGYSLVLPDKITIFKSVIESLARHDDQRIAAMVHNTVLHEVAHHLGFDEREVRAWENKRRN